MSTIASPTFNVPRLCIVGTDSDAGKTTISIGLMALFRKAGLKVQPFKLGYDFLDSYYHSLAAGRPSMNLHTWMVEPTTFNQAFQFVTEGADLAILEGGAGIMYLEKPDFLPEQIKGIQELKLPVVLIIDVVRWPERSRNLTLWENLSFDAVILNRCSNASATTAVRDQIAFMCHPKAIWEIPLDASIGAIENRYLGFVPYDQDYFLSQNIDCIAEALAKYVNVDMLLGMARSAPALKSCPLLLQPTEPHTRIAVAQDIAFDHPEVPNLKLLEALGATLVPFSPLRDSKLPSDIHALYLSGRWIEMYAQDLLENQSMYTSIRNAIESGLTTFAECGGFLYLTEKIQDYHGRQYPMLGLIPGTAEMKKPRVTRSVSQLTSIHDTTLTKKGEKLGGYEDHFGDWQLPSGVRPLWAFDIVRKHAHDRAVGGWIIKNAVATLVHTNFLSNINLAHRLCSSPTRSNL